MNIRPRNIQKYQGGGTFNLADWIAKNQNYYNWYKGIYPNAQVLAGDPLKQNQANANYNELSSSHHTTDDLQRSAYNNYLYTSPDQYSSREADIINWATKNNIDLNTISDEDFVNTYNKQAQIIRDAREAPQTYNKTGYARVNQIFRDMFGSRSQQGTNHPLYNIGYQENLEDIGGTSTWQRRMDRYEKRFQDDTPENQKNRTFYITRPDGRKIKVYKKENGDLGLFNNPNDPNSPKDQSIENSNNPNGGTVPTGKGNGSGRVTVGQGDWGEGNPLSKLGNLNIGKLAPAALNIGRLWNTLHTNKDVYKHMKKAIFPVLQRSYHTHRQLVGDEGTKQAYYRRAAEGQSQAARPVTSDMDKQIAYQMEAKRIGDQLRAEGDLADNKEIRRTSDESMQHAWQNQARDTQVANENTMAIAKADAARHQLDAQEASARGTSWDEWIKGLQYNIAKRNQEELAYQNTLDQYDFAYSKLNDEKRKSLQKVYEDAEITYDKNKTRENYNKVNDALKALKAYDLEWQRQWYVNHPPRYATTWFGRKGGRFNYDYDAELLYKVSRDAVKHFREMSKQTDESRIKTLPKAIKLKDPPKSRKYQYGGQAPFMVYTPLALGGVGDTTSASASSSTKSSDKKDKHDTFDVVKDLFKEIAGKGLPSDVSVAYDQMSYLLRSVQASGGELDSDDLASMYLKQMQVVNNLQFEKAAYDKAKENVTTNKGLGEIAVDSSGRIVGQDENGDLKRLTLEELKDFKGKFKPFTNEQLLSYRAYSPNKAFDQEILQIVNNGVGIEKVAEYIKAHISSIGTDEFQQEGYSKKEAQQIISGIQALQQASEQGLAMAPDGTYKGEYVTETQERQMQLAINYLKRILPENMKTVLAIHGGNVEQAITEAVVSRGGETRRYKFDAVTGKAAKDTNSDDTDKLHSNPLIQMIRGQGGIERNYDVITRDSNVRMSVEGTYYSSIPKVTENMSIDKMLSTSGIQGILDSKTGITFGDQNINPENLKDIMFSNTGVMVATLPCKIVNGHKEVNFEIKDTYEAAVRKVLGSGVEVNTPQYYKLLGEELQRQGVTSLLNANGELDRNKFGQFVIVEAYATSKVKGLDTNSQYIERIKNPTNELEQTLEKALSTNNKKNDYDLDIDYWFWGDDVYRGSVFIPISQNINSAINAWGKSVTISQTDELEEKYQLFQKAANAQPSGSNILN